MKEKAYAKINLALDVICRREDGYHELDMIMAPISLCDEITIDLADKDIFTCSDGKLLMNEANTVVKAIQLIRERYRLKACFSIHIEKHIPMQAGLAGGSADAAAVIRAVNQLCKLDLSQQELIDIGVNIGADVPFCLVNKVARVKGIGEKIRTIPFNQEYYAVLVKPESGVSTKECFQGIDFSTCIHPDMDSIEEKIIKNENFTLELGNTLEQSAFQLNKDIKEVKKTLLNYKFDKVLMSGSGSSIFALTTSLSYAKEVHNEVKTKFVFAEVVKIS